jgi:cytochrome P450
MEAFEHGPRNCIAEGIVMTEIKLVLAHLVREFEFKDAHEEWDVLNRRKGPKAYRGERAYQVEQGAAHPA